MKKLSPKVTQNFEQILNKILGKRVFIFDLETTGLFDFKQSSRYWDNKVFESARIIEIGYYYSDNFGNNFDTSNFINSYLRKPKDFNKIDPESEKIHNISIDNLIKNGYLFSKILNKDLLHKLNNSDYIISHNIQFDLSILMNELYRFNLNNTIKYILDLKKTGNILCTCRSSGYKKLNFLYNVLFNEEPEVLHRAGNDVKTLIDIIIKKKSDLIINTELN